MTPIPPPPKELKPVPPPPPLIAVENIAKKQPEFVPPKLIGTSSESTPLSINPNLTIYGDEYAELGSQFITLMDMDQAQGKIFTVGADGKLEKQALKSSGSGTCTTVRVRDVHALKAVLLEVANNPKGGIILGFVDKTQPEEGEDRGVPYRLVTDKALRQLAQSPDKQKKVWKNKEGLVVACRTAMLFKRSTWICFDLDTTPETPVSLIDKLASDGYHACLQTLIPQLEGIEYLSVPSSSSRVSVNGVYPYKVNRHIYMQTLTTRDQKRFASATLLRSQITEFGYRIPAVNAQTKELEPHRRPSIASIIDPSVFSRARIMFEGQPSLNLHQVQSHNLAITPPDIQTHDNQYKYIDTTAYSNPIFDQQILHGMELVNASTGFNLYNNVDLTPDILIEYKDDETGVTGFMTAKEFAEGTATRLRCQNPFKPSSQSWSAFLTKENQDGKPIIPRLVSVEYGIYIYNEVSLIFNGENHEQACTQIAQELEIQKQPQSQTQSSETQLQTVAGTSLQTTQSQTLQPTTAQNEHPHFTLPNADAINSPREYAISKGVSLDKLDPKAVRSIPEQLNDPNMAEYIYRHYFNNRPLVSTVNSSINAALWEWTGVHYKEVDVGLLDHLIVRGIMSGNVPSFTRSKLTSTVAMLRALSYTVQPIPLPTHIIPFANTLFDCKLGKPIPHTNKYFYDSVKDINYDPSAVATVAHEILDYLADGDDDWSPRTLDLYSYLMVGGENTEHIIVWMDGTSRSGKSIWSKGVDALTSNSLSVSLKTLSDTKIQLNFANKALIWDDDVSPVPWMVRDEVVGVLKKMSTGARFQLQQLYTSTLSNDVISAKMLFVCNGIPPLPDPHGALAARSEIIKVDKVVKKGDEDVGIEDRFMQSQELSGLFNLLWANWLDLLTRSGYTSLEEYRLHPSKPLKFATTQASTEALQAMCGENEPLTEFCNSMLTQGAPTDFISHKQMTDAVRGYVNDKPHLDFISKWSSHKIIISLDVVFKRNFEDTNKTTVNNTRGTSGLILRPPTINWGE